MHLSRDFVWMAPLALMSVTLLVVTPFVVLGRAWRPHLMAAIVLFVSSSVVFLDLLMLVPGLLHFAAALLAAGLAVQAIRAVGRHPAGTGRLIRRSTPWLLAYSVATGVLMWMSLPPIGGSPPSSPPVAANLPNVVFVTLDPHHDASPTLVYFDRQSSSAGNNADAVRPGITPERTRDRHIQLIAQRGRHRPTLIEPTNHRGRVEEVRALE